MKDDILSLKYPTDINISNGNEDTFANRRIIFMAMPGEPSQLKQKSFYESNKFSDISNIQDIEVKAIISLPIPSSLSDQQTHSWSSDSLVKIATETLNDSLSMLNPFSGKVGSSTSGFADRFAKISRIVSKGKDALAYGVGQRKVMMKPGYFQNYDNSGLRSFSFTFDFVAENREESEQIQKIIGAFKILSSPSSYGGGASEEDENEAKGMIGTVIGALSSLGAETMEIGCMYSPFVWQIVVTNEKVNKMLQLKTCVCTNVQVTYGNDKFDCFEDGMPKYVQLGLSFNEVQLQYAENYNTALNIFKNDFNTQTKDLRDVGFISRAINSFNKETYEDIGTQAAQTTLDPNASTWDKTKAFGSMVGASIGEFASGIWGKFTGKK